MSMHDFGSSLIDLTRAKRGRMERRGDVEPRASTLKGYISPSYSVVCDEADSVPPKDEILVCTLRAWGSADFSTLPSDVSVVLRSRCGCQQ